MEQAKADELASLLRRIGAEGRAKVVACLRASSRAELAKVVAAIKQ